MVRSLVVVLAVVLLLAFLTLFRSERPAPSGAPEGRQATKEGASPATPSAPFPPHPSPLTLPSSPISLEGIVISIEDGAPIAGAVVLRGNVKDIDGKPIAGAYVGVLSTPPQNEKYTHTDEKGNYEMEVEGEHHIVSAIREGYRTEERVVEGKPPERLDFTLRPAQRRKIRLSGFVRDRGGRPAANISVSIVATEVGFADPLAEALNRTRPDFYFTGETEDNAFFSDMLVVGSEDDGGYCIEAIIVGDGDRIDVETDTGYRTQIPLAEGDNVICHDIVIEDDHASATTVTGQVVDGVARLPIEGMAVGCDRFRTYTDAQGLFSLVVTGVKGLKYFLVGEDKRTSILHDPQHPRTVDMGEILLYQPAVLICAIRDDKGFSVQPGITVESPDGRIYSSISSDDRGIASSKVKCHADRVRVIVCFSSLYHHPHREEVTLQAGEERRLDVVLRSREDAPRTVLVTDKSGTPIAGAIVDELITDKNGRATGILVAGVSCGVWSEGYESVNLVVPESLEEIHVTLRRESAVSIKGRVMTEEGKPVAGAYVYSSSEGGNISTVGNTFSLRWDGLGDPDTSTNGRGQFEIKADPDGIFTLWAVHPYLKMKSPTLSDIRAGGTDVTLVLHKFDFGRLVLRFSGETPPDGSELDIETCDGEKNGYRRYSEYRVVSRQTDLGNLFPGRYTIYVTSNLFLDSAIRDVLVSPGETTVFDLHPDPGITLAGRVLNGDNRAASGVTVSAGRRSDVTGLDGSFRMEHVSPASEIVFGDGVTGLHIVMEEE